MGRLVSGMLLTADRGFFSYALWRKASATGADLLWRVRTDKTAPKPVHVEDLPDGLDTAVGSGGHALTPAQAQQVALARLVLLDPHTLVLDEATSLLDPRAARDLERSLNAVLEGRTVVAIAHRLHTAHDADRVAVVDAGRITEIGPHAELVAAGGDYATLWHSWQSDSPTR